VKPQHAPLSFLEPTVAREELHFRNIDMRGYKRADGLYEIEGRVVDRKPHPFSPNNGGRNVAAGEAIHDMLVRLVFNDSMLILDVLTYSAHTPYQHCPEGGKELQTLKGLKMSSGWAKEVRARLSGARACTHLMEILLPMASAAFQTLTMLRLTQPERLNEEGKPLKIDSCYAYGAQRELVRTRYPQYYITPTESTD
jgi:hypothetical protein